MAITSCTGPSLTLSRASDLCRDEVGFQRAKLEQVSARKKSVQDTLVATGATTRKEAKLYSRLSGSLSFKIKNHQLPDHADPFVPMALMLRQCVELIFLPCLHAYASGAADSLNLQDVLNLQVVVVMMILL